MSNDKLSGLAAAFRSAVAQEEAQRKAQLQEQKNAEATVEAQEAQRKAEAHAARLSLIDELAEFGKSLGDTKITAQKSGLNFSRGEYTLSFRTEGEEDRVSVISTHTPGTYLTRDVSGDWLLCLKSNDSFQYLQLVTEGLEELLVLTLGYPRVSAVSNEVQAPTVATQTIRVESTTKAPRKTTPDPTARATVDPNNPTPGSTVKDLHDPFA